MQNNHLGVLTLPHYGNVLLTSPDGKPLSTLSKRKAAWYVNKQLVNELPPQNGYPRILQLKFLPKNDCASDFSLLIKEDKCVVCGATDLLTKHHVIPYCIRRVLPIEHREYKGEWLVLLCRPCHFRTEKDSFPVYSPYLKRSHREFLALEDHRAHRARLGLISAKKAGNIHYVKPEVLQQWLIDSKIYKTIDDVPIRVPKKKPAFFKKSKEIQTRILKEFVVDHGGVEGVKEVFRKVFMKMEPQYLPKGFLEL